MFVKLHRLLHGSEHYILTKDALSSHGLSYVWGFICPCLYLIYISVPSQYIIPSIWLFSEHWPLHGTPLHSTTLHCTALHCIALHCTALHCTELHCTALHCIEKGSWRLTNYSGKITHPYFEGYNISKITQILVHTQQKINRPNVRSHLQISNNRHEDLCPSSH